MTFHKISGVLATSVGYTGGTTANPTYRQVCQGDTGHAEAVKIEFDPDKVSYAELLEAFWQCHDPTTMNRQGPDIGSQYRSGIFFVDEEQKRIAETSKIKHKDRFSSPIVTQIVPASEYYLAEDYHQFYVLKRRGEFTGEERLAV